MQAPPPPGARRRVPAVVQQLVQQHRADQEKRLEDVLRRNRSRPDQASPRLAALLPTTAPTTWRATTPAASPPRWASFAATVALPEDLGDGWRAGGHSFDADWQETTDALYDHLTCAWNQQSSPSAPPGPATTFLAVGSSESSYYDGMRARCTGMQASR